MNSYSNTASKNTNYYHHMSSPKTEYRSRKRPLEDQECDDSESDVQVVAVKKRKSYPNQGVLSANYVSRGLSKIRTWFKDSSLNSFAKSVLSALSIQPITDSSDSSDSENSMPINSEHRFSGDSCNRSRRHRKEYRSHEELSTMHPKQADHFVTIGQGNTKHTIKAKVLPQVHRSELEIEIKRPSRSPHKQKWSVELKSTSKSLSRQHIHPNKQGRADIVDLTDASGKEPPESSARYPSHNVADEEPEVVNVITNKKPKYLTTDIQFVRNIGSVPRPPFLKEWSNGDRISPVKLFSQSIDSHFSLKSFSSRYNGSTLSRSNSFTTSEVIRIQEKEQYKMLLEHFSYAGHYQPSAKPSESKNAETQVCAEKDIDPAFRKEILGMFPSSSCAREKHKPCQLVKQSEYLKEQPKKKTDAPEEVILDDDDDDEPLILETKRTPSRQLPSKSRFFSEQWIEELKKTVAEETEERRKIVEEQQKQIEEYKAQRAKQLAEKQRIQKLKHSKAVLSEGIDEKERLPEITPEMDAIIEKVLKISNPQEPLAQLNGIQVLRKDLDTLSGFSWLNDEIINFYIGLIVERSKQPGYPSVYGFNTFFYPSLRQKGYSAVKRWTRKVDIFSYDLILVPLHLGLHWCLGTIDFRKKKICFYDSMQGKDSCLEVLRDYLVNESLDKKKQDFDLTGWTLERMQDIPPQLNGSDCGMFTLKYAEYISRDARISFTQENMPYFRRRMMYEIVTKKIIY